MSSERLREAARVLRERAEAATPGPWESKGGDIERYFSHIGEWGTVATAEDRSAAYIATMHPGVGLALAELIECDGSLGDKADHLEVIADLILGDAS